MLELAHDMRHESAFVTRTEPPIGAAAACSVDALSPFGSDDIERSQRCKAAPHESFPPGLRA
jgi:hypothetical protein